MRLPLVVRGLTWICLTLFSFRSISGATGQTDFRYLMMVDGKVDGYPNDDDVTAIARYLIAMGDKKLPVPDVIASWIVGRIGNLGHSASPRLTSAYMHFLRLGSIAPPFESGELTSARYRLLRAAEDDLQRRNTPQGNLALLMFREIDDPGLRQVAEAADYTALRSFSWLVGHDDWTDWIVAGLSPDDFWRSPEALRDSPDFPIASAQAKAGLLRKVRAFIATLDIHSPVSASSVNFRTFSNDGPSSWGYLKGAAVPYPDDAQMLSQTISLATVLSHRVAATLGLPPVDDEVVKNRTKTSFDLGGGPWHGLVDLYRPSLNLPKSVAADRFSRLGSTILFQQKRLLALGSYALLVYQRSHHLPAADIGMHEIFSRLGATYLPTSEKRTEIAPSLPTAEVRAAAGTDIYALSLCSPTSAAVVKRLISLQDRTYFENINVTCKDGKSLLFSKVGILSTDFARMIELNKDYLDIVGVSLIIRELTISNSLRQDNPEDLDLIRTNPADALALMLGAMANPDVPWDYVRDSLLKNWPKPLDWVTPTWRPQPTPPVFPVSHQAVLVPFLEFATWKERFFANQLNLLQFEARHRFLAGIAPTVDALPATRTVCTPTPNGGVSCVTKESGKNAIIRQVNFIVQEANHFGALSAGVSLSDPGCMATDSHDMDRILVVLNEDSLDFATSYMHGWCLGAAQGPLQLQGLAKSLLMRALKQDPIFLNRFQFDVLSSRDDWGNLFSAALERSGQEADVAMQTMRYLQMSDLLYYLPSIAAPLAEWDTTSWDAISLLRLDSPFDAMTSPLLRSQTGLDLATDLAALQDLARKLPPALAVTKPLISDSFIAGLRDLEHSSIAALDTKIDAQVSDTLTKLKPPEPPQAFVVGFSLGIGTSVVPGLYFSYQGVGIDIALHLPTTLTVTPTVAPFTIPGIPLAFPGSGVLGPLSPSLSLPLPGGPDVRAPKGLPDGRTSNIGTYSTANMTLPGGQTSTPLQSHDIGISSEIKMSSPNLHWDPLLESNNYVGRTWLASQVSSATPLLTKEQLIQINHAFLLPTFPADLVKLISAKAAAAARRKDLLKTTTTLNQVVGDVCRNSTWTTCGIVIKRELDKKPADLEDIVELQGLWGSAYGARYDALRIQGHLQQSTPDSEKIWETMNSVLNPVEIVKDKIKDGILKRCLGKLAFLVEVANKPVVSGLKAFFDSSEIATDYNELRLMNEVLQTEFAEQLEVFMVPTWRDQLSQAVNQAAPQWVKP